YTPFFEHRCSGTKDIALLKLAESVSDDIHHICLPHLHDTDELYDSFARLFSFGYGSDRKRCVLNVSINFRFHLGIEVTHEHLAKARVIRSRLNLLLNLLRPYKFLSTNVQFIKGDSGGGVTTSLEGRHYLVGLVS
ncbi:hypothetical protein Angca_000947, partial [Angiostrongylus cantonensis]